MSLLLDLVFLRCGLPIFARETEPEPEPFTSFFRLSTAIPSESACDSTQPVDAGGKHQPHMPRIVCTY